MASGTIDADPRYMERVTRTLAHAEENRKCDIDPTCKNKTRPCELCTSNICEAHAEGTKNGGPVCKDCVARYRRHTIEISVKKRKVPATGRPSMVLVRCAVPGCSSPYDDFHLQCENCATIYCKTHGPAHQECGSGPSPASAAAAPVAVCDVYKEFTAGRLSMKEAFALYEQWEATREPAAAAAAKPVEVATPTAGSDNTPR